VRWWLEALVQTLNAEILASRSATLSLEKWCGEHRLAGANETKIVARLMRGDAKPATAEQRQRLQVGPDEELKYRRVQLLCGDRVLSEADNWYVPSRLTPEMNRLLETTDTPFGKAVLDLKPYRRTFAAKVLWWPLAQGWEMKPLPTGDRGEALMIPDALFEHQAVLFTKDRAVFRGPRGLPAPALGFSATASVGLKHSNCCGDVGGGDILQLDVTDVDAVMAQRE
jgi:chorismate-pyruvate lyase